MDWGRIEKEVQFHTESLVRRNDYSGLNDSFSSGRSLPHYNVPSPKVNLSSSRVGDENKQYDVDANSNTYTMNSLSNEVSDLRSVMKTQHSKVTLMETNIRSFGREIGKTLTLTLP